MPGISFGLGIQLSVYGREDHFYLFVTFIMDSAKKIPFRQKILLPAVGNADKLHHSPNYSLLVISGGLTAVDSFVGALRAALKDVGDRLLEICKGNGAAVDVPGLEDLLASLNEYADIFNSDELPGCVKLECCLLPSSTLKIRVVCRS